MEHNEELIRIITKFAESEWDLIDIPSKEWLKAKNDPEKIKIKTINLIEAIKNADYLCGSCGCEFDCLYKKALELLL